MKKYDLAVKIGTNKQGKAIWKNVGSVLTGQHGEYILLDKTFNPAGVPGNESSVLISYFEPKGQSKSPAQELGLDDEESPF